ncbi:hypothetical protein BH09ACT12_BH09ACT12_26340 [soil metagenome]
MRAVTRAGLAVLALGLSGCSSASTVIAPSGVDELTVPVATPDPDDFAPAVGNPWLTLDAAPGPVVAGVATTEVVRATATGSVDYYAQDTRGNVWWFGREGSWMVGEDGAEAGLVITAVPRLGDGYQAALAPTADVALVSEVVGVDVEIAVGTTTSDNTVAIDTRDLTTGRVERAWYAEGIGLVQARTVVD